MMVNIKRDILNQRASNVPGRSMTPNFITVHNTANPSKGADAEMHSRYQHNGSGGRQVSWHYTVDDKEAWQTLEDNQQGWHAGDGSGSGNTESIGVEICENRDGDFQKAVSNAQKLIKHLMDKHGIPLSNVVTHKHWSGKNCPRLLLDSWDEFKSGITGSAPAPSKSSSSSSGSDAPRYNGQSFAQAHSEWWMKKRSETEEAQRLLNQHGYNLAVDGILGQQTLNAVRDYQDKHGISYNGANFYGVPGPATLRHLKSNSSNKKFNLPNVVYRANRPYPNGSGVRIVQEALAAVYYYPDKGAANNGIDGYYGPKTADAVRRFQSMHGLTEDGVYGPNTRVELDKQVN